ncbi:MAG TPA: transposase [Candidatus Nitrosocosmicus sp.]
MVFILKAEIKKNENKHRTILKVPDELWAGIKSILPNEKPLRTVGRRLIIRYRKVIDEILYVLRTEDANGKCYLKNMVLVLPVIVDFRSGID